MPLSFWRPLFASSAMLCIPVFSNASIAHAQGMQVRCVTMEANRRAQQGQSVEKLEGVSRVAEARINASNRENIALRRAATPEQLRAILLRNGFTAKQLKNVSATKHIDETAYTEGAQVAPIKIAVRCCPSRLIISW